MVESWSDDVPKGKVTDFRKSVQAKDDEAVVFSWFEYPDRAARDAANEKMMSDPRMKEMGADMPFDGKRMIYGGFDTIVDERGRARPATPMASSCRSRRRRRTDYQALAQRMAGKFKEYGAVRVVEAWGDDVPDGKVTDYQARREGRGRRRGRLLLRRVARQGDPRCGLGQDDGRILSMQPSEVPFDGKRMFWGGFSPCRYRQQRALGGRRFPSPPAPSFLKEMHDGAIRTATSSGTS